MRRGALSAILGGLLAWAAPAPGLAASAGPPVTGVELVSAGALPARLVHAAILPMAGRPRSRDDIRESLERLWALDLFSGVRVEELVEPAGVRLRFHLARTPYVERVGWEGDTALSRSEIAAVAALPLDGDAGEQRLERARRALLAHYAQEGYLGAAVRILATTHPETQATAVTFVIAAGARARIGTLRVQGLGRFPSRAFRRALDLSTGNRYREEAVRDGVRAAEERMRKAGFLEATVRADAPDWDPATNRVALTTHVTEGPEYRIEFVGETRLRAATLREALPFAATGIADELAVENGERLLREAYRERGYHFARVTGEFLPDAAPRVIRYRVVPGPRVKVARLEFDGNRVFRAKRLQALIQTRPATFYRSGYFRQDLLERDLRVLLGLYRSQGMGGTKVGPPQVTFSDDRRRARVRIPIEEGTVVRVASVRVEGATVLPAEEILSALPVKTGTPWSESLAEEVRRSVTGLYARKGYESAEVTVREQPGDGWVDLSLRLQEGERTRLGRLLVSGLVRTREQVVRREFPLDPADPFDPQALAETERRLGDLGIFQRIELEPLRPPPTPFTDVAARLQEAKPWRLDLGAGYSTDEGPRGSLELGRDNLFGSGRRASIRGRISSIEDSARLLFTEPRLFGERWQLDTQLYGERRREIGYRLERTGIAVEVHRELPRVQTGKLRAALGYRLELARRSHVDPALIQEAVTPGTERIGSLRPSLTWDRRNDPLNPTRGGLYFLAVEGAGAPLASEVNFVKSEAAASWLFDWLRPTVLALSVRVGLARAIGQSDELPIEERFFAGGESTIRGYKRNRVGPRDEADHPRGGNARILLNAEWRFPIWRFINGALFVDSGMVRPEIVDLRLSEFKTGVGGGLRLVTPVGPLRFDVGYGLNPVAGDEDRLAFYFSVGYPF